MEESDPLGHHIWPDSERMEVNSFELDPSPLENVTTKEKLKKPINYRKIKINEQLLVYRPSLGLPHP